MAQPVWPDLPLFGLNGLCLLSSYLGTCVIGKLHFCSQGHSKINMVCNMPLSIQVQHITIVLNWGALLCLLQMKGDLETFYRFCMIIDLSCTLSPVTIVINIHSPNLHPKLCKDSLGWSLGIFIKKGYLSWKRRIVSFVIRDCHNLSLRYL